MIKFPYCPICKFEFTTPLCKRSLHNMCIPFAISNNYCLCRSLKTSLRQFNVKYSNCSNVLYINNDHLPASEKMPEFEIILFENRTYIYYDNLIGIDKKINLDLNFRIEDDVFKDQLSFVNFMEKYLIFQ